MITLSAVRVWVKRSNIMNTVEKSDDQVDSLETENSTEETDFIPKVEHAGVSQIAVLDPS
jgi:hypothetical protein